MATKSCIFAESIMKEQGQLKHGTVVSTVMSNLGFYKGLEEHGINSVQTAVGDRYVVEEMKKNGYNLGGEQSGHIIFLDYNTTGDGLLLACNLVNIMKATNKPLSELAGEMKKFPQILVNVRVTDKYHVTDNEKVKAVIEQVEAEMNGNGRILFDLLEQSHLYVSWQKHQQKNFAKNM